MPLSDLSPLSYFKELHLLPRAEFTIGGAFFFGGLFIRGWRILLLGAGLCKRRASVDCLVEH
jgi:hypothetical protein